jgi:N-carbamoylputrescine amidase
MRTLKVLLAHINCIDEAVEHNSSHAYELANGASKKGAELVLFPEFMPQGYRLTNEIWNSAEPFVGLTTNWLAKKPEI